jgi:hypothetical protein
VWCPIRRRRFSDDRRPVVPVFVPSSSFPSGRSPTRSIASVSGCPRYVRSSRCGRLADISGRRKSASRRHLRSFACKIGQTCRELMEYRFMLSNSLLLLVFRPRWGAIFSASLMFFSAMVGHAPAQAPYDDRETAEAWAWARIKEGRQADFNVRCGTPPLDPHVTDDSLWTSSCRRLSATFLVDMLTHAPWRDEMPFSGVNIIGARILGNIDLENAKINRALLITQSRIENNISLFAARTDTRSSSNGHR